MTVKTLGNRLLGGSSLIVLSLAIAQTALAQDITVNSSITTSQDFSATAAPGSNMTVTSDGTINTSTPNAITITGTIGSMLGTLLNSGLINNTATLPGRAIDIGTVSIAAITNNATGTISAIERALFLSDTGTIGVLSNLGRISATTAIVNNGSIGSLSNTGQIIGVQTGMAFLQGVVGTVNNSGTIRGGAFGISIAGGSFGPFINSGTLIAPTALDIASTVPAISITNSGVIAGTIINRSANILAISGGAGAVYGTLTGNTLTNQGSIISTLANLNFVSGNLLLNSNINVTGRTVTNTGATVRLNSIVNITGNYSQSLGTIIIAPDTGGLVATGPVSLTGGRIVPGDVNTGNYFPGTQTIIRGSSYSRVGASVTPPVIPGLSTTYTATANSLNRVVLNNYVGGTVVSAANALNLTGNNALYVAATGSIGTFTNSGTMSGTTTVMSNLGRIDMFINSGLMSNVSSGDGVVNSGTLAQLLNTGTISLANKTFLKNTGTVGTVTNSGVITADTLINGGVVNVINNSNAITSLGIIGSVDTIINSGLLKGSISGGVSTIIGGSGGAVGTFAGYNAGVTNNFSLNRNLTFASGSVLMQRTSIAAQITPSLLTISNIGADLTLSTITTFNSNYVQTAGSLNLDSTSRLDVSQIASITGGAIGYSAPAAAANYLAGATVGTLVTGGAGSSYVGVTMSPAGLTGLARGLLTSGNNLLLTIANNYVGTALATLTNSGTLTADYPIYVSATGSLGGLDNSGTLSGTLAAIRNLGTLGAITNSGVIAGNIDNLSAQTLSITGGTLTGYAPASQGTINSTLGNVVLGGTIALNDAINVGTNTVSNNSGVITINSNINVIGNFSQSSGVLTLNNASMLTVSGAALFTGGTISTGLSTAANYVASANAGTLIQGGPGSSYVGVSIDTGTTGLSLSTAANGNNLVLNIRNNYVSGSLASIVNTGSVSADYAAFVAPTGTLGTLTNSGTLSGSIAAISNQGSLGPIINTGVIAGNIDNLSAQTLSISGGTLTGFAPGSQGTINSTLGNVVLGGNIALNDAFNVAGNTVVNDGGSISLSSPVSITGNFSQNAGTLNSSSNGSLVVTGAASITGGTVAVNNLSATSNYLAGSNAATLVAGGAGSNYSGATTSIAGVSGLAATATTSGNNLVLNVGNNYLGTTLGSLSNTGTLSGDYPIYVAASGSLGSLSNSGTLSGSIAAIRNLGTLSAITNSGVIAGNIDNLSAQTLSITGGTLTGYAPASQGTINSTLANVVLAGNIALNDAFNVGSNTVVNNGGTVIIDSNINVIGNFSQSSGALTLNNGSMLTVSGAAQFTGGTVSAGLSTAANYLAGFNAGTLIQGGAGSSYSGATLNTGVTGLTAAAGATSNNLVLSIANNYVGSALSSLTNSASLSSDYPIYVAASGSLGDLTNSGTLSGAIAAINNLGTLGPITNSGVIAGNIDNFSAQTLSITGGTLTGYALGSQGTITSTLGNVVLAGNMTLNDAFNVGANTVVNNGGSITINSNISVLGNFSQSSGLFTLNNASMLNISGAALFTGGTVSTGLSTSANYLFGANAGTLIQGGAGSSYSGVSVDTGATGLSAAADAGGNNLVLNIGNNYVGGSLASLTNSGTLTAGYPVYVAATGSLGDLTNSGTLSGAIAAIRNLGTLGPITNTGVIAGNIDNFSAQDLSITGGTLTGYAANSQGTITSTLGNVVLAGTIALNNAFNVGSNTVINNGGSITVDNNISVIGNFSQSSGLLILNNASMLAVSGAAQFTGGTISTGQSTQANYLASSNAGTLIQGGPGSSYSGVSVDTGVTGLSLSTAATGNNLVLEIRNNYVSGSITSITNTGTISADYAAFVAPTGSLGSLTNSGTLSGSIAAISNQGSLGPIINTGVIAGNIDNLSAQTLSITGGTLTGFAPSSQGTINSTLGNVVLGGNIALNDSFNVAGNTVVNNGGSVSLSSTVSITGNFSQSAGTLDLGSTGSLVVSQAASITGGTVAVNNLSATSNYLAGSNAATLVAGGVGSNYSGATTSIVGVSGLATAAATSGNDLVLNVGNNYLGTALGSLSNTGTLSGDYPIYVAATGSVGNLTNSGTLSGSISAIRILGTLGAIVNTGVIAGNIDNLTAQVLSISGGTLTGFAPGSQGTITSTLSNVVLAGNIALNSAINVGNNTVVSDGAALQLSNPVRVTGNYSQTGGTLLVGVTSTATYGQIQVSGSANLTGTNIRLVPLGSGTIAAGQAFTVVRANGTLTYSNLSASVADLDGNFSTVTSDGATGLVLSLKTPTPPAQFTATGIAAGQAAAGTGAALDAIINTGGEAAAPFITEVLLPLAILSPQEQQRAISQLSPSQFSSQVISIATSPVVNAIEQRQETLADAGNSGDTGERGMSAGSPDQSGAVWGQVLLNAAKRDATSGASPYVANSYGLIVGADLINTPTLFAGGALSWVNSIAEGRAELTGSHTRLNSYQATGYFTWKSENPRTIGLKIDGQLGVAYNDYNQQRQIDFLGQRAKAAFGGQQYLLNLRAGYTMPLGETASITPFVGLREVHLRNSRYSENGAGAANLKVDQLIVDSVSHEIGLQGLAIIDTASGRFAPSLKIGWVHSYTNGLIPMNAELGGNAFTSTSTRGPNDGLSVGSGLTYINSDRVRLGVQYDGELRQGFQNHSAMIKVKYNF